MTARPASNEKLRALAHAACDGALTQQDAAQLEELLRGDPEAQRFYLDRVGLDGWLRWEFAHETPLPSSPSAAPVIALLDNPAYGTTGYFSGWPTAYLVATVVMGIGLLVGSLVYVSQPEQIAKQSVLPSTFGRGAGGEGSENVVPSCPTVGRITGMVDCQWKEGSGFRVQGSEAVASGQWSVVSGQKQSELKSSSHQPPVTSHLVSLGDRFALASGLMEITYDTGAKVILQGPVNYEVESVTGGFLSVGKLTGRVTTKAAHGFTIHTPTATVTDLGTEFGVEVSKDGNTTSHVYRGLVRVQMVAVDGNAQGMGQVLHENESARVDSSQGQRKIVVVPAAQSTSFIREIPKPTIKTLDLVDVVAGGNGFSGRRGAGIDPSDGRVTDAAPKISARIGDGQYHRVAGLPLVDGVFIPDGHTGKVQVDSAGHTFDDFSSTSNMTAHYIWAGGVVPIPADNLHTIKFPTTLDGVDYASSGHGLLFMHANKGITFDLKAVRQANPGWEPVQFRAIAGSTETASAKGNAVFADVLVLVDGQERFKRREINNYNGAMPVNIPIGKSDRFVTLVATDGGNGIEFDWIIFGDPRLVLISTGSEEKQP